MTRYTYQRLSSQETIRIIRLQPAEARSDIRIVLRAYPVSAVPEFEAISYVWGTGIRDHTIQCDGADLALVVYEVVGRSGGNLRKKVDFALREP
ncbi:hypothetical protein PG991_007852 [Apiospora marii]|uniref:Heterokaryon incompatibility domain-containing protein n=1 Tax=Apiospora marii TaxID=335849 RepID=A0ABR1RUT1_9PEZI